MFDVAPPIFRPPAEADSLILRVASGCPHNACAFCAMYRSVSYRARPMEEIERDIRRAARDDPDTRRVFLADGDALHLPTENLEQILGRLREAFPRLARVNTYANGLSILSRGPEGLRRLRARRLHTLYLGLESGDPETLRRMGKPESVEQMLEAGRMAREAGLRLSVMVLLGLAGPERSVEHARATAEVLSGIQPELLAALRVIPVPGTPLERWTRSGDFRMLTEREAVLELRELVASLRLNRTVFRANHTSNVLPVEAQFPRDRERLLRELDAELVSGRLDASGPGPIPWIL
jgi:radical SAM superfamily enzyme YgiQ (UPF0313 family)